MPRHTVVVGASLAGIRAVQALRRTGWDDRITVVGAEPHLPYDRPPLSKEFLLGKAQLAELALVEPADLSQLDVDLRLGTRATALDVGARRVSLGTDRLPFDTLIIATGSTPRSLGGTDAMAGVHTLRTVEDAVAIRDAFDAGARVVVIGGGFIGAEVACAARSRGLDVTIIDPLPAMMMRGLGAEIGRVLARRHADNGTHLRLGCGVASLAGHDRVEGVVLDDGSTIDADLVVVGIGVDPAVDWLADCGIDVRGGVACDAHLRVRDGVYVVGDAARWTSGAAGTRRLEHWTNAVDQAAALADTLTGRPTPYDPTPYVWSDQLGTRLQVWGDVAAEHEIVYLAGDADSEEFVAACGSLQGMHGVVALGARREAMRAARLLHAGAQWRAGVGPVERVA